MKISPKTERWLNTCLDKAENFSLWFDPFMRKVVRGFFWVYLFVMNLFWLAGMWGVFLSIRSHLFDLPTFIWLLSIGVGLIALYSYLNDEYIGHPHFWKVLLVLTVLMDCVMFGLVSGIFLLILVFPTLYALYKIGFDYQFHELLCMLKIENMAKLDRAIYEKELTLPPGSKKIRGWEALRFLITSLHTIPPIFRTRTEG